MSKEKSIPLLTFLLGLISAVVVATAYLHTAFASKEYVQDIKHDLKQQLNRIEYKIDGDWPGPKLKDMQGDENE